MSTIYLHIPFCKQACHYCDFHFSTLQKTYIPVLAAMLDELEIRASYLPTKNLSSIYFGGGTPSLLKERDLNLFLEKTHTQFQVMPDAEITLEANPDDLTMAKLKELKNAGINRLSIGTQSFINSELNLMNRVHTAIEAEDSIKRAQDCGFENLTIDLIYGMPQSSMAGWKENVGKAIALQVPHLSAYALTVEPKTALAKMVANGDVVLPSEAEIEAQYMHLIEATANAKFDHYELSNFGKTDFRSKHNTSYWEGTPYLGVGPSAHSFDGKNRQWNVSNNTTYANSVGENKTWFEVEELDDKNRFNEFVMTGLRTAKGISLAEVASRFGLRRRKQLEVDAKQYLNQNRLKLAEDQLVISEKDWLISDRIISDLFWV